ncbi:MAG: substrate-binding domain-containing protein [Acetobacteraceae bacterium]|nr:substrate-binding domain-containing protein [Acetobacteraceae bacterium]
MSRAKTTRRRLLGSAGLMLFAHPARGSIELHVLSSGGLNEAYNILGPQWEQATGHTLRTARGASMGAAPDAIPQRLARGEPADVVLLAAEGLDGLIARGLAVPGSRVDIARSLIGMAVREGAPKPDISTPERLRDVLLAAASIGYSASASGVYIENEMFRRLGIHDQVMPKARKIFSERVAAVVARGEVEVGFQQVSEIIFIPGVTYVGTLPDAVQRATIFSAGIGARAANPEAGRALIRFLASAEAAPQLARTGLEPLSGTAPRPG